MTDDTADLLAALEAALAASGAPEQRAKRERLAAICREAETLSAEISAADDAVTRAEKALGAHLAAKHTDPAASLKTSPAKILSNPDEDMIADPDVLDGSVMEIGDRRYVATAGRWVLA